MTHLIHDWHEHRRELSALLLVSVATLMVAFPPFLDVELPCVLGISTSTEFPRPHLEAKAAVVSDLRTGELLFGMNEESQLPLASVTKLMTALIAVEHSPRTAPLVDEIGRILTTSSNEGAVALTTTMGESEFVRRMNGRARELGLTQTYFLNPTGLDHADFLAGAYGSARDVSRLMAELLREEGEVLAPTRRNDVYPNTNTQIEHVVNPIASKTGTTDLAGGNLAYLFDAGIEHPVAIVVLGSTPKGRFRDVEMLVRATLDYLNHSDGD